MKNIIALDVDDNIFKTCTELHRQVVELGGPKLPESVYLTLENTNGVLQDVLDRSSFMGLYNPRDDIDLLGEVLCELELEGISTVLCTHRAFHYNAQALSAPALEQLPFNYTQAHFLDPAVNGDKVAFLTDLYGDNFYLVDDRPRFDDASLLPHNVLLMDQPWNRHMQTHTPGHRIYGLAGLTRRLRQIYRSIL